MMNDDSNKAIRSHTEIPMTHLHLTLVAFLVSAVLLAVMATTAHASDFDTTAGDFDADGQPDPAAGALTGAIAGIIDNAMVEALAVGDFDCDGVDDLAVGVPLEDIGGVVDTGLVVVMFGEPGVGLSADNIQEIDPNASMALVTASEQQRLQYVFGAEYGASLAVGEFDEDPINRCDDLAIGAPGFYDGLGAVDVLYGSVNGLMIEDGPITLGSAGFWASAHLGDGFGEALAAGDFDGNDVDDLAIGIPWDGHHESGRVAVLYGDSDGLDATDSQYWAQGGSDEHGTMSGTPEDHDLFGATLASDDFDGDGNDDLAISAPGEDNGAGVVHVLYGSKGQGLTTAGNEIA